MSQPLLELRDVDAFYGDVQVLHALSFSIQPGEIVSLLGSNGAGKTTALRSIAGLLAPARGELHFRGQSLARVPAVERSELGIALVPEGRELWPLLSVEENLQLGAYGRRVRSRTRENLERIYGLFPRLQERRRQLAGSLSGGEQQMCAIGRALMSEPELLMLDEPSVGLAPIVVQQLLRIITELHAGGTTVLLVEQNLHQALAIAQRGAVIETGRIRLTGSSEQLRNDPMIRAAYLGL
jgi:branched-chain amino acid transport system ATP-binding protein